MAEWKISLRLIIRIDVVTDYAEQGDVLGSEEFDESGKLTKSRSKNK